jgi:hypothetical protein
MNTGSHLQRRNKEKTGLSSTHDAALKRAANKVRTDLQRWTFRKSHARILPFQKDDHSAFIVDTAINSSPNAVNHRAATS